MLDVSFIATAGLGQRRRAGRLRAISALLSGVVLGATLTRVEASVPALMTLEQSVKAVDEPASPAAAKPHRPFVSRRSLLKSEATAPLGFEVVLKMRNFPELQARVGHGERISPTEMAAKYNPTDADYLEVIQWLTSQGFEIARQDKNHLAVFARARVEQIRDRMKVRFARVTFEGKEFTSAVTAPSIPAALAPLIVGINGLQPHLQMHKHFILRPESLTGTNSPYLPSQLAKAYNANSLYSSNITGAGQTIAIVIDTFPSSSDLTSFWSTYGVNQSINNVTFIQTVPGTLPAAEGEETLDTEWSSSIAPGAKVRVYASQSLAFSNLDQTYQEIYSDVVNHPEYNIHQMSMSYGIGENYITQSQATTDDQYFAELASAGVTVFASSGDSGSTPGPYGAGDESGPLQVSSPASDPNVTGVGGTSLVLNTNGTAGSESVWNNGSGASGGGASIYFDRPYWQTGSSVPVGSTRLVPDVSSAADPYNGAVMILNGSQVVVGGTSWSSPTWAAFCALINQNRSINNLAPIGLLNPYLYPFVSSTAFRDITSGDNATSTSDDNYHALPGYDEATGVGVPNMEVLAQTLLTYSPAAPQAPAISSESPPANALINTAYTFTFSASGYPAPTYAITSGSLPPGLSLSSSGALAGSPTQTGTYTATVSAGNGIGSVAAQTFSINVLASPAAPILASGLPTTTATETLPYRFQFAVRGYPVPSFQITGGSLPPGVTLSSAGLLLGTPTATGVYTASFEAANGISPNISQSFSITVSSAHAPSFTNGPAPSTIGIGASYSFAYAASGSPLPVFSLSAGSLPPGLSLSASGVLSGTPTKAGSYTGTVTATNSISPGATQNFTIAVQQAPSIVNGPPPATVLGGSAYAFAFQTSGFPVPTFTVTSGSLPPGISITSAGVLSGSSTTAGTFPCTVTAINGVNPKATQSFSITVQQPVAPVITNGPPPAVASLGSVYGFTYAASGFPVPTFSIASGSLPPGLTLASSGLLSGSPRQTGSFTGTVAASNGVNPAASQAFSITIGQGPALTSLPLSAVIGLSAPFSFAFQSTGFPAPSYAVTSGSLPAGVTLSAGGILLGTPTATGTFTGVLTASNSDGEVTQNFSIKVVAQASQTLTVNLPAVVNEGDADGQGLVYASTTPSTSLTVTLTSSNTGAMTLPATVVILAGQNSAAFPYTIIDNLAVSGSESTVITGHASGWSDGTQQVTVTDNKTTDNWSSYGNGPAHAGVYPGSLLGGTFQQIWSAPISSSNAFNTSGNGQVAVAKGLAYVTSLSEGNVPTLKALNAQTGAQAWQDTFSDEDNLSPPSIYKGSLYFQALNNEGEGGTLWSLRASTGAANWNAFYDEQSESYLAPTVFQTIGVWVDGGEYGGLYGFDFNGAQRSFTNEPQEDEWTPTYYDGVMYTWVITAGEGVGTFQAVNPATGAILWSLTEPGTNYSYSMNCAAPVVDNLAYLDGSTALSAVNVTTRRNAWSVTGTFNGTPAVSNGLVYVISGSQVKVLNATTGATVSSIETLDSALAGQPVVATDSLIVSSSTATYLYNIQTGALVQTIPYGGAISVAGGNIYLAGTDGFLRVFQSSTASFNFAADGKGSLSSFGYTATGQNLNVALSSIPTPGEVLTVINNTSSNPISGTFNNLANGGTIDLAYNGTTYIFTANYSGGDGNDLTLTFTSAPQQAPAITNGPPPSQIAVNHAYDFTYFASGYPAPTFAVTSGSLPPGLTLTSSGQLSGSPTAVGTYSGTVTAVNSSASAAQDFSIVVQPSPALALTLPAQVNEGDADGQGELTLNITTTSALTVTLASSNATALTVPVTVTIPAGQSSVAVPYTIIDNLNIYGAQTTTVSAQATSYVSASHSVTITDNKTSDNWSSFGNGQAHTGVYPGALLEGTYNPVWTATFPSGTDPLNPVVIAKGLVYVTPIIYFGGGETLSAINASTGAQVWQYNFGASGNTYYSINPPTVYKGNVYLQQGQGLGDGDTSNNSPRMWNFNAATGQVNWTSIFSAQYERYLAPTIYQSAGIMVDGGEDGGLYNFNFDGTEKFMASEPQFDQWTPTYYNGMIYTWVDGTFTSLDPVTGATNWSVTAPYTWEGYDMNCAAPISGDIAILNGNQTLSAVNVGTKSLLWTINGPFTGTAAMNSNVVYAISGTQVLMLNAATGAKLGDFETSDPGLTGQPVIASDSLVVSSTTATYLFSLQSGSLVQTIPQGGPVSIAGDTLYIAGSDGTLRAYRSGTASFDLSTTTAAGLTTYGFNATGQTLNVDLNFIPTVGSVLTVINNTGPNAIAGTFSNLPNGGSIQLTYNGANHFGVSGATTGATYTFTANYSGGDGNDLTLTYTAQDAEMPMITSGLPPLTVPLGSAYSFAFTATAPNNSNPTFSLASGHLPPGLTLTTNGALSGTATKPGTYTGSITAISNGVSSAPQTVTISVMATFAQWTSYFNLGAANAAPLNDGVPNLLKYLYDIDPGAPMTGADWAALPSAIVDSTTNPGTEYISLLFRKNASSTGLLPQLQTSSDLKTWTTVTPDINQAVQTDASTGDPIMEMGVNLGTNTKKFLRLSLPLQ